MKTLSLLQPWASLVVFGFKALETRGWQTTYRGELLIHASKGKRREGREVYRRAVEEFKLDLPPFDELPFGAIIGQVKLRDIITTHRVSINGLVQGPSGQLFSMNDQERAFGDYSEGRFAWLLQDPQVFTEPIPAKGNLSLWEFNK